MKEPLVLFTINHMLLAAIHVCCQPGNPSAVRVDAMIRSEIQADFASVRSIHCAAFHDDTEANLVEALRFNNHLLVSLVAMDGTQRVGHVAFSPVRLDGEVLSGAGLAPVAVAPSHQGCGFGQTMVRAGLDACRDIGVPYVVVLGEPAYYQRFGFRPATRWQLENEYGAGDEFMAIELVPDSLHGISGLVRFGEEFRDLS
ncbi:MAG: N-acetyltransferase [Pirellulales bacterium]